ncbi:MAG TPA: restriction endonuclease subunit S [Anaerolineales bacterium]|nr:restriction endonuclease subunit S [Anaerolineales bacterium]
MQSVERFIEMSLPSDWKLVKLADVAAKQPNALVDGPFGSNLKLTDYVQDGVPVLQGKNITGNKFQRFDIRFISEKKAHSLKRSLVKEGDILIVKIGSIGYSAQIDSLHGYTHALIPANLCKLTPDLSVIDPTFLVYYLNSNDSVDYLRSNASATSQPALSLSKIKELPVPLPSLPEQKRIASLLKRADRLRQLRRMAHDLGDALLQSVFLEMFGDVASNPKGWDIATLEDLETDFIYGTSQKCFSEPKGFPVLRIPNVLHGTIDLDDLKYAEVPEKEANNILLKHGDIIFVRTNGNPDYVGRCAVFNLEKEFLFASYLIRARLDLTKINPVFLLTFLQTSKGREAMAPYIRTTAGQSNIGIEGLGQIPVPIPPLNLQEEFAGVVRRVEALRGRMGESERQVNGLFESLLSECFERGQLP